MEFLKMEFLNENLYTILDLTGRSCENVPELQGAGSIPAGGMKIPSTKIPFIINPISLSRLIKSHHAECWSEI
jgi:hypothetical protein